MLILGDISGIHQFVTNIADIGGGQAKRLRARSFYVQLLCEVAAVRVLSELNWPIDCDHLLMSAAGHFVLRGQRVDDTVEKLSELRSSLNDWLLRELQGEVHLGLAWSDEDGSEIEQFRSASASLNVSRMRSWNSVVAHGGAWLTHRMSLEPLDTPCALCRRRTASIAETDPDDGSTLDICSLCDRLKRFGRILAQDTRHWLTIRNGETVPTPDESVNILGMTVTLQAQMPNPGKVVAVTRMDDPEVGAVGPFASKWIRRRLARHIPRDNNGMPVEFQKLASEAMGDQKLGVLKADGDGMGDFWTQLLQSSPDLSAYCAASAEVDEFSAADINGLLNAPKSPDNVECSFQSIYTVFSGGDDLLFIGPWDVILDFAGVVQRAFSDRFKERGLTLSAGIAIVKQNWPVKRIVAMAEELLEKAKNEAAFGRSIGRDQVAALGGIWTWEDHQTVIDQGRQWIDWVRHGVAERGWLQTICELNESARNESFRGRKDTTDSLLASARLDYLLERRASPKSPLRLKPNWESLQKRLYRLQQEFDNPVSAEARLLSPSLRYAILATRSARGESK